MWAYVALSALLPLAAQGSILATTSLGASGSCACDVSSTPTAMNRYILLGSAYDIKSECEVYCTDAYGCIGFSLYYNGANQGCEIITSHTTDAGLSPGTFTAGDTTACTSPDSFISYSGVAECYRLATNAPTYSPTGTPTTDTPTTATPTGTPVTTAPTTLHPTTVSPTTVSPATGSPTASPTVSPSTGSPTTLAPTGAPTLGHFDQPSGYPSKIVTEYPYAVKYAYKFSAVETLYWVLQEGAFSAGSTTWPTTTQVSSGTADNQVVSGSGTFSTASEELTLTFKAINDGGINAVLKPSTTYQLCTLAEATGSVQQHRAYCEEFSTLLDTKKPMYGTPLPRSFELTCERAPDFEPLLDVRPTLSATDEWDNVLTAGISFSNYLQNPKLGGKASQSIVYTVKDASGNKARKTLSCLKSMCRPSQHTGGAPGAKGTLGTSRVQKNVDSLTQELTDLETVIGDDLDTLKTAKTVSKSLVRGMSKAYKHGEASDCCMRCHMVTYNSNDELR